MSRVLPFSSVGGSSFRKGSLKLGDLRIPLPDQVEQALLEVREEINGDVELQALLLRTFESLVVGRDLDALLIVLSLEKRERRFGSAKLVLKLRVDRVEVATFVL